MMLDIHCHLMPGVDDGPETIEAALQMVQVSYDQGIRKIVLTPHLNHPLKFKGSKDDQQDFEILRTRIWELYPEMELYLGAEVYLSRQNLNHLEKVQIRTMNGTAYVLVEFSREIQFQEMDHGFHELMLMGYKPILAHAEIYKCLNQLEAVSKMREEGIFIQCNSGNLMSLVQTTEKKRAREFLKRGWVDFIASDGHGASYRPPYLAEVYQYVLKNQGKQEAKRLFVDNPQKMLAGEFIAQPIGNVGKPNIGRGRKPLVVVASGILVVSILILNALNQPQRGVEQASQSEVIENSGLPQGDSTKEVGDELSQGNSKEVADELFQGDPKELGDELSQGGPKEVDDERFQGDSKKVADELFQGDSKEVGDELPQGDPTKNVDDELHQGDPTKNVGDELLQGDPTTEVVDLESDSESDEPALESSSQNILHNYEAYLKELETYYQTQVDIYFQQLKEAAQIVGLQEREAEVNTIKGLLSKLEARSDNEVYKALYDLQNELEEHATDIAVVQELRDHYNEVKVTVSNRYQTELEDYYALSQID